MMRLVSFSATGSQALVGRGGTSTIVLAYPPHASDDMTTDQVDALTTAARRAAPVLHVDGTSLRALDAGSTAGGGNATILGELIIGALVVLAWVFGSLLAALPLIMALISVLTMQLLIYALTYVMPSSSPINPSVQVIVALLGLGLSIDYSLLVVTRCKVTAQSTGHAGF